MSEDLHGRTWCMAGSGKARYESDHSFHVDGKRVDTRDTPYLLRSKQSEVERMSDRNNSDDMGTFVEGQKSGKTPKKRRARSSERTRRVLSPEANARNPPTYMTPAADRYAARTPMAQQTVMPQAMQDMMAALWQLQLQADNVREERRDRERQLKEERKQREREEARAAQRNWEDRDRVERREREDRETQ